MPESLHGSLLALRIGLLADINRVEYFQRPFSGCTSSTNQKISSLYHSGILFYMPSLQTVQILGLPVHNIVMSNALSAIRDFVSSGGIHQIITADASMLVIAQDDPELFAIIQNASLVTPDSIGVLHASKRYGKPIDKRVSGVELVEQLCAKSPIEGYRLYFFGAAPGVAEQAASQMNSKYPGCQVVGAHDGFFNDTDIPAILKSIKATKSDILCVAFGIPKQEKWIAKYQAELGIPVAIGVGGTFDVLSGTVKRAPVLFQKLHIEWLWRVISNPKKYQKVALLPKFVRMVRKDARKQQG